MRKQFEKWYADTYCEGNMDSFDLASTPLGQYVGVGAKIAWAAWQAAWEADRPSAAEIEEEITKRHTEFMLTHEVDLNGRIVPHRNKLLKPKETMAWINAIRNLPRKYGS
jgi:hypothetical protein